MKEFTFSFILTISVITSGFSQNSVLENGNWKLSVGDKGTIEYLTFKQTNHDVPFFSNEFAGPSWYIQQGDEVIVPAYVKPASFQEFRVIQNIKNYEFLNLSIEYKDEDGQLVILATITNSGPTPFQPTRLGLRLGIDTYMEKYPDWNEKMFPTLLRCESTHFWGYCMSPTGKILVIASPDPIASWSHEYSKSWGTQPYKFEGHRITSINLDLINAHPLPERHPQNMWQLKPGETKTFRIYLDEVDELTNITAKVASLTKAPMIDVAATSCEKGQEISFSVNSIEKAEVEIYLPNGKPGVLTRISDENSHSFYTFGNTDTEGLHIIKAISVNGRISEASVYVRKPYSWYMKQAMKAVADYPPKASHTHCESWYGFFTSFTGGKYFPENEYLKQADEQFAKIYPAVFDTIIFEPHTHKSRIQNASAMVSILVDRYELFHEEKDLQHAINLTGYLLRAQTPDGAFRSGKTHYTSVLYIAKALIELLNAMEPVKNEADYKNHYKEIYTSVKLSIEELELNRSNIQTEGELTYEDGMISCSALQLGYFALMQTNNKEKEKYKNAALEMLKQHDCLEQLVIPDARMRSATLRFWEAQYDVLMANNFFNSPHDWSSWTTYANYYAYLLTGDTNYLIRTFNGLDAAMQMIDINSGKLRWAFMVNPFVEVTQINRNIDGATPLNVPGIHYQANLYSNSKYTMGEEYVEMVSDWFFANANDNDVHEHFKCLDEVALNKAYVAENINGDIISYNCIAEKKGDTIIVQPSEAIIEKIHVNLTKRYIVLVQTENTIIKEKVEKGMSWMNLR